MARNSFFLQRAEQCFPSPPGPAPGFTNSAPGFIFANRFASSDAGF